MIYFRFFAVAVFLFSGAKAFGYSEMIRHNYVNCTTCHVNQNGGGILTEYGRALSLELLATWGKEGQEQFLMGVVKPPSWLSLGGDIRAAQTIIDTPQVQVGRWIWMQFDIEAAAKFGKFTLVGTIGREDVEGNFADKLVARRHYINYDFTEKLKLRAGRFLLAYGLRLPDHAIGIKRGLNWDHSMETYNVEASFIGDETDLFVTGSVGRPDDDSIDRESGFALRTSHMFEERLKIGLSYFYGNNDTQSRHVVGPYFNIGFSEKFYLLSEFDLQNQKIKSSDDTQLGYAVFVRPGWEITKGLHLFLTADLVKQDASNDSTLTEGYGPGVNFYPFPHLDFQFSYNRARQGGPSSSFFHSFWLMSHIYL